MHTLIFPTVLVITSANGSNSQHTWWGQYLEDGRQGPLTLSETTSETIIMTAWPSIQPFQPSIRDPPVPDAGRHPAHSPSVKIPPPPTPLNALNTINCTIV
jgi:hypothetical protein